MDREHYPILGLEQKKDVVTYAKEQFAFLKTEKGFIKPLIHQPANGLLIYRNATIGLHFQMHFSFTGYYYDYMQVMIGKVGSDGKFPIFPYMCEEQVRCAWSLQSFLIRQLHIQDEHISAPDHLLRDFQRRGGTWDVEQWKEVINLYQTIVYNSIDLILQQPSEVLFPTSMEYLIARPKDVAQLIYDHFAFLQEYGFQRDPILRYHGAEYTWMGADRGIQFLQDFREHEIFVHVVKLIDGKFPTFDKKDLKHKQFIKGKCRMTGLMADF